MQPLTQEEIERHQYESLEMACRDALSWEREVERNKQKLRHAEQERDETQEKLIQTEQRLTQVEQEAAKALIAQITLCEQFLQRPATSEDEFQALSLDELRALAARLQQELIQQRGQ